MIKYLRLPFDCDVARMRDEALALAPEYWKLHYNKVNYEGNWTVLPLYSMGGKADAIYAMHQSGSAAKLEFLPTPLLEHCPSMASVLGKLHFSKRAVRLMRLEIGAEIKEHNDIQLAYEEGQVRLHLPLQTNAQVEFFVHDERIVMNEGELWYLNLTLPHRVTNHGTTDRIHLVIDGDVNDWLDGQFNSPNVLARKDAEEIVPSFDEETRLKMIHELRLMGTETALQLAQSLQP